nr:replicative DNA helicase [Microvirga massiliensis]
MAGEQRRTARAALGLPEERVMPHNLEVEAAVLGSLLLNNDAYGKCADILTPECFFEDLHRKIFEVTSALLAQGKTANAITLKSFLADVDLGGLTLGQYLFRLQSEAALPSQAREYAMILNDLHVRRQMISVAEDMLDVAYNAPPAATSKSLVYAAVDRLVNLRADPGEHSDFEAFDTASDRAVISAQEAYKAGGALVGLSTGLPRLDDALGGLQDTDLIILAGRPGMGKTALATNIAFNVGRMLKGKRNAGERTGVVGFNSLEMSSEQLTKRIISEQSGVPLWKVRRGFATEEEMERFILAQRELRGLPLEIDQTGELSIAALRLRAKALKKRKGLSLLIVDYLQLLKGSSRANDNRVQEVTEITTGLKALAKELEVPVIALSQLSRKVEERDDKRPMLADLRESGSIEQDADIVMFVYREEYYLRKMKAPPDGTEARLNYERAMQRACGIAEVIVGKNRHGPEASVVLGFDADVTKFLNEPWEREIEPLPERERKEKQKRFNPEVSAALGAIRSATSSQHAVNPSDWQRREDRRLKKSTRLVPVEIARSKFADDLGPGFTEKQIETKFSTAVLTLQREGIAYWTRGEAEGEWYVFMPELTG